MDDIIICSICSHQFSNRSNLNKHIKKFHPDELNEGDKAKKQFDCMECGKCFIKTSYLKIHVKKFHSDKYYALFPKKSYDFKCDQCGRQFTHKFTYNYHIKKHSLTEPDPKNKCPICSYKHSKTSQLMAHYENHHNIVFQTVDLEFETIEAFHDWKYDTEKEERSLFVFFYHTKNKSYEKIKYVCHRSGNYRGRGQKIRQLKLKGSNKINGICPASICVILKQNKCFVTFQKIHVGHDVDLGHLHLIKLEKEDI